MVDFTAVLIGGAPGAGKTTLARALALRLGFSHLTVDDLAVAIKAVTNPKTHPSFHPVDQKGHVVYFTDSTPGDLIEDAKRLEVAMWPVIDRVLRMRDLKDAPVVIDWWLLRPATVASVKAPNLRSLWLHIDPGVLAARERALTEFRKTSTAPERMFDNFQARSDWRNELILEEATDLALPVLHQTGAKTVAELVDEAIAILDQTA